MLKNLLVAIALVTCALVLGGTVFQEQVASAAQAILPVLVTNDASNPVPVREQATTELIATATLSSGHHLENLDVSRYKEIRISFGAGTCNDGEFVQIFAFEGSAQYGIEGVHLCGFGTHVFDTPGRTLSLLCACPFGGHADVAVWGRTN